MYKILIKIDTKDGNKWSFYQEDGEDYIGYTLQEIKETALLLLKKYGRKSIKIINQKCADDTDNVIEYIYDIEEVPCV